MASRVKNLWFAAAFGLLLSAVSGAPDAMAQSKPAKPLAATELARNCGLKTSSSYLHCVGYLGGAIEMLRRVNRMNPDAAPLCAPALSVDDRRRVFLAWTKANPTKASAMSAVDAIHAAIQAAYPC